MFSNAFGQFNFQKTFLFNDTIAVIQNIFATDSCYYFSATTGNHPSRFDFLFGKLSLDGSIESTNQIVTLDDDRVYSSHTEFDTNFRGNLIVGYSSSTVSGLYLPKLVEIDFQGIIVDSFYLTQFYNGGIHTSVQQMVPINSDSSYLAFGSYNEGNSNGVILFKFNQYGDTIWSKKLNSNTSLNGASHFRPSRIVTLDDGSFLCTTSDHKDMGLYNEPLSWARIHFYQIDGNGTTLKHAHLQDSPVCYSGYALTPQKDGTILHTYIESKMNYNIGWPQYQYRPVISKLDSNFNQIWKDTLRTQYFNFWEYAAPAKLISNEEGAIIGAYNWSKSLMYDSTIWNSLRHIPVVKLFNYSQDGALLWNRTFNYISIVDSINEPEYTLLEIEETADKGYIISGYVDNYDSLNAQAPSQFGYVLKTNCLGFMGSPEAYCSHQINNGLSVDFYNSSIQAGYFEWDFGDGSPIVWSGEKEDSLSHQFTDFGPFLVTMIAHGCNGDADTLKFYVSPALHLNPSVITDNQGYFAIFPNPVISGNKLIIYLNGIDPTLGNVKLELYSEDAKLVQSYPIGYEEGSYLIESNVASGMYHINLIQAEKVLQSRKLVVE